MGVIEERRHNHGKSNRRNTSRVREATPSARMWRITTPIARQRCSAMSTGSSNVFLPWWKNWRLLPVEGRLDSWKQALDFIRHFADGCHHLKEEKVLFPAMEEHGIPRDGGPIGMMLTEHEEGRGYVRTMMAALTLAEARNEAAKDTLLKNARAYLRLLQEHIQKEDEILFRIADDVIPPDEQKELSALFRRT